MRPRDFIILTTLLIMSRVRSDAVILQPGWTANWQSNNVGVVGGIPNVTSVYTNFSPGVTIAQLNTAFANAPSNSVVLLANGIYDLTNGFLTPGLGTAGHSFVANGVVFRGTGTWNGSNGTLIRFHNPSSSFFGTIQFLNGNPIFSPNTGNAFYVAGGASQYSTTLVAGSDFSQVIVGMNIIIDQQAGFALTNLALVNPVGYSDTQVGFLRHSGYTGTNDQYLIRAQTQTVTVTGINTGNSNITISPGLYMTNWSTNNFVNAEYGETSILPVLMCGIENMTIDDGDENSISFPNLIQFNNCRNSWVKNVETTNSCYSAVNTIGCCHIEIRDSFFHDCASLGGSTSYGVNISYASSDCLVENNIFSRISSPIILDQGSSGNVFGYNFMTNMLYQAGTNITQGSITTHGAHPSMNLFEGNWGESVSLDFIHGSSSHNTFFRDRFTGLNPPVYATPIYTDTVEGTNWYNNFVGCVLGTTGSHTSYEYSYHFTNVYTQPPSANYFLGFIGTTNSFSDVPVPVNYAGGNMTADTTFRHGNWDSATQGIVWDTNTADHSLPNSYYLASKPSWWLTNSAWPLFDPTQPALPTTNLPAAYRFYFGAVQTTNTNSPAVASGTTMNAPFTINGSVTIK